MKKITALGLFLLVSLSAQADSFSKTMYVKVLSSEPVYQEITEYSQEEKCQDVRESTSNGNNDTNSIMGTIVGGAIGGVLGHQIGGGKGKNVATVGGAILGSMTGNRMASSNNTNDGSYQIIRKCTPIQVAHTKTILSGYNNHALVDGNQITVFSNDKVDSIPVSVNYSF